MVTKETFGARLSVGEATMFAHGGKQIPLLSHNEGGYEESDGLKLFWS